MTNDPAAPAPKLFDPIDKPKHYNLGKVECIDALEAATVSLTGIEAVCTANAIKYLWRWKQKNGVEDLKKGRWYLDHLITHEETTKVTKEEVVSSAPSTTSRVDVATALHILKVEMILSARGISYTGYAELDAILMRWNDLRLKAINALGGTSDE